MSGEEFGVTTTDGVVIVAGEVDAYTSPRLREHLEAAAVDRLVLDLSAVRFMDSSGLQVLVSTHRQQRQSGGVLELVDPSPIVERLLEISGLRPELTVTRSDDG